MKLKERAGALKRDIPAVYLALRRKDTPLRAKLLAGAAVCYALPPIDLIPDFLPVLGYLDDLILLPLLTALAIACIPKDILEECREESAALWTSGKPKSWKYAVPILLIWILIILLILRAVL